MPMRLKGWGETQLKDKLSKDGEGLACHVKKLWLSSVVRDEKTKGKMARTSIGNKDVTSTLGIEYSI